MAVWVRRLASKARLAWKWARLVPNRGHRSPSIRRQPGSRRRRASIATAFPGAQCGSTIFGAVNQVKRRGEGLALAEPIAPGSRQPPRRHAAMPRAAVRRTIGDRREQIVLPVGGLPAHSRGGGTKCAACVLPVPLTNLQGVAPRGAKQRLQRHGMGPWFTLSSGGLWAYGSVAAKG